MSSLAASRLRRAAVGVLVVAAAAFDLATTRPVWLVALSLAIAAIALSACRKTGLRRNQQVLGSAAVAGSCITTPALTAAPGLATGLLGLAEGVALLALLVVRWRADSGRRERLLTVAVAAAVVALPLRARNPDTLTLVLLLALVAAVAVTVAAALREQDANHAVVLAAVRRSERDEIARELHDVVAHHVTGIVVTAQALQTVPAAALAPTTGPSLAAIEAAGTDAMRAMRRLVEVLRQPLLPGGEAPVSTAPTAEDVTALVARLQNAPSAPVLEVSIADDLPHPLPAEVGHAAYRVAQESLTNALRHADRSGPVTVTLQGDGGFLVVQTTSRVRRTRARSTWEGGHGLVGMRERVEALGGAFSAGPDFEGRWVVTARLPLLQTPDRPR